tara:strand:- start:4542 stop:4775 length:234 start_codon:yes stop_codon:yes gene_type:complete
VAYKRDYKKEYDQQSEKQKKRRAARKRARRFMEREGRVKKNDGKEVDHKDHNPENNSPSNLRVVSKKTNRERQPKRS